MRGVARFVDLNPKEVHGQLLIEKCFELDMIKAFNSVQSRNMNT